MTDEQTASAAGVVERIAAARAVCDAATPGPWRSDIAHPSPDTCRYVKPAGDPWDEVCTCYGGNEDRDFHADAHFIAATRTELPRWLSAVEALRTALIDSETSRRLTQFGTSEQVSRGDAERDADALILAALEAQL